MQAATAATAASAGALNWQTAGNLCSAHMPMMPKGVLLVSWVFLLIGLLVGPNPKFWEHLWKSGTWGKTWMFIIFLVIQLYILFMTKATGGMQMVMSSAAAA